MKNKKWLILFCMISLVVVVLVYIFFIRNAKERNVLNRIQKNSELIKKYCEKYDLDPRVYVSVVFGELNNNLNFFDDFDEIRASLGFDPSVGFGQMRVSTFMWIEEYFSDGNLIKKSKDNNELVTKISNNETNIIYTTFYIDLIRDRYIEKFASDPSVTILGSYYSRGIDFGQPEIEKNYFNKIGIIAEKFYHSDKLDDIFPRRKLQSSNN